MAFWQVIIIFGSITILCVLWPLIKFPFRSLVSSVRVERDETQVELYKEHLDDLDASKEQGDIDDAQYDALKKELQRSLVDDSDSAGEAKHNFGGKKILMVLGVITPILAAVLYFQLGSKPDWEIHQTIKRHEASPPETQEARIKALKELLIQISARLKQKPNNHQLRYMLAEYSMDLQDYDEAVKAYRMLLDVEPSSPRISTRLAQALFARGGNKVTEEMGELLDTALTQAPFFYAALELGGIVAFHEKEYAKAAQLWERAYSLVDKESRAGKALNAGIMQARAALSVKNSSTAKNKSKSEKDKKVAVKPAIEKKPESVALKKVLVDVSLGEGVKAAPSDTVFVYARAWQGAKMPLAIKRLTVADLPQKIQLDSSMAMAPGMDISSAAELELLARVSKSGGVKPKPGDWEASLGPVTLTEDLGVQALVISKQIP